MMTRVVVVAMVISCCLLIVYGQGKPILYSCYIMANNSEQIAMYVNSLNGPNPESGFYVDKCI